MKKKWIIIITISIILIIGLVVGVILFVKNFNEDKKQTLEIMENIKIKYNEFSPFIDNFSSKRAEFYTAKEELFYLETINDNKEKINTIMSEYDKIVMDVDTISEYLKDNCNRKYSSSSVNNTCNLFKQEYEAVINYYITDLKVYNTLVREYNSWITENKLTHEPLAEQKLSLYSDYIDYDKDGSYLGGK